MNFNLFPKFGRPEDFPVPEEFVSKQPWPFWSYTTTPTFTVDDKVYTADEFIKLYKELWTENENNKALLKSIEEDGTKEHNAAVELRQENAKLKKDIEDQKQLKDSLQRVNEKYIKKITQQQVSISELTKEIRDLRHLKTENVELIERLLQKEGKSYGITFNEAKTQIIQNDYKKCAEERDEYKHQLDAANKEIEVLKRWKKEQLIVQSWWDKVDNYVRDHDDAPLGGIVANTCLNFLKERDELKAEVEKLKKESQKHPLYPLHWGGYDKNIIDFVNSEFSNEDPLKGEQVKEAVEELKNMKTQGFEDYDPSDFEQPVKEVEFNAEELLKRVTEYADTLNDLPKSFPNEFQDDKTTAENLEERFDEGKDVLDYFEKPWKCPCNKCKEAKTEKKPWDILKSLGSVLVTSAKTEKSWEEVASDLALKVAKLERMVEELKVVRVNNNLNLDSNYEFFKKNGKWPWQWNEAESLNEKLYD